MSRDRIARRNRREAILNVLSLLALAAMVGFGSWVAYLGAK